MFASDTTTRFSSPASLQAILDLDILSKRDEIKASLKDGRFGLVLRRACNEKLYSLIQALLENVKQFSINLNETSSNGNTALDWFDKDIPSDVGIIHKEIRERLCSMGALTGKKAISKPSPSLPDIDFDPVDALLVSVDELATALPESDYPVLGTIGAGQCLILGIYDSNKHKALVTHITGLDKRSTKMIKVLEQELATFPSSSSEAYILGGLDNPTSHLTHSILTKLLAAKGISVKHSDVFRKNSVPASFAINTKNGRVHLKVDTGHFDRSMDRLLESDPPLGEIEIIANAKGGKSLECKK